MYKYLKIASFSLMDCSRFATHPILNALAMLLKIYYASGLRHEAHFVRDSLVPGSRRIGWGGGGSSVLLQSSPILNSHCWLCPPSTSGSSDLLESGYCSGELAKFVCLCQPAGEELIDISAS